MTAGDDSMKTQTMTGATITHAGTVVFEDGAYKVEAGTGNWTVAPIPPGIQVPVGQVLITLDAPITRPYSVLVTAERTPDAPLLCANWGDATSTTFVVVLFNPVGHLAYQTVRNGGFSFALMQ
jgi:hypothetical protein